LSNYRTLFKEFERFVKYHFLLSAPISKHEYFLSEQTNHQQHKQDKEPMPRALAETSSRGLHPQPAEGVEVWALKYEFKRLLGNSLCGLEVKIGKKG
jgi:hypothetical protein